MATVLNVIGLAVAFAAFMLIMMQLDYDYNYDRSHKNNDRIYRVESVFGSTAQPIVSRPMADAIIASSPHILAGSLYVPFYPESYFTVEVDGVRNSFKEKFIRSYPTMTDVFEFDMIEGSSKALEEPEKVLVCESLAKKIFGNQSAVGKVLTADIGMFNSTETNLTVGGIYKDFPKNSVILNGIYIAIPKDENKNSWGNSNYEFYIRVDQPENSVHLIDNFRKNFDFSILGEARSWVGDANFRLTPLTDVHFTNDTAYDFGAKSSHQTLLVLLAIAIIIVLIAGINYTNFSTALTPIRIKSINTQKVLGETERNIRFSLIVEAVSISIIAYMIGLVFVFISDFTFISSLLDADPKLTIHPEIVLGTAVIALVTGLLAGIYPSYYMTSFQPALVLKGSFGLSPKGRQLRNILIGVQFMASFALIIGASFMYLQNNYMQNAPLGYDKDQLIVTDLNKTINGSLDAFTNKLKLFSGIDDVTYGQSLLATQTQYMGWGRNYRGGSINFQCLPVSYTFLKVMGIPVTEGRDFREEDDKSRHGTYIFNEKARLQYDMRLGDRIDSAEVIGFMPDVKFATFHIEVEPMAFFIWGAQNWGSTPNYAYIKVNAGTDLRAAITHVKESLSEFDTEYPFQVRFYDAILNTTYEKERSLTSLITLFSLVAIFISIVGVFGLVVFDSEYRKKEIGIRKVLGSTTQQILILFNKTYIRILCICFILAAPLAYYAVVRWLENFAYKTPLYWWVFLISFVIISVITVITVTFQNYWAANDDPVNSIKSE